MKISTNPPSNYTAINKPVAHVQMRKPKRVHTGDGAIARRLSNCSLEPYPEGPCGWNRDAVSTTDRRKQAWFCIALLCTSTEPQMPELREN